MRIADSGSGTTQAAASVQSEPRTEHNEQLIRDAQQGSPVAAGSAKAQLDAQNGSKAATDAQVHGAQHAAKSPLDALFDNAVDLVGKAAHAAGDAVAKAGKAAHDQIEGKGQKAGSPADVAANVVEGAADFGKAAFDVTSSVASSVAQKGTVESGTDFLRNTYVQGSRIAQGVASHPNDPVGFANWLAGPDAPGVSDVTKAVPGLQQGIDNALDGIMSNPHIAAAAQATVGFKHVADGDYYVTTQHSAQSHFGYTGAYDKAGKAMGMDLDDKVVKFKGSDGTEYKVEFWKGNYAAGGAFGGEVGVYTRGAPGHDPQEAVDPDYYSAATGDHRIQMSQTIYDKTSSDDKPYFTNPGTPATGADADGKEYWNLGIQTKAGVDGDTLGQRGTLTMQDDASAQALADAINAQSGDTTNGGALTATVTGNVVTFNWA